MRGTGEMPTADFTDETDLRTGKGKSKDEIQGSFPFASLKGQDDDLKLTTAKPLMDSFWAGS